MAQHPTSLKIACDDLSEADRAPLVSAINSIQARIGLSIEWTNAQSADIRIVDASACDSGDDQTSILIRYAPGRNGPEADLCRPLRTSQLQQVLANAADRARQRATERLRASTSARRYRGAIIDEPAAPEPRADHSPHAAKVTYRGWAVD